MTTTHSAGTWFVTHDANYGAELAIDTVVDGRTVHIALVHGVGTDEETQANAALIATAPTLVQELDDAADMLHELALECAHCNYGDGATGKASDGSVCEECSPTREAERRAREVVAKARGEQS